MRVILAGLLRNSIKYWHTFLAWQVCNGRHRSSATYQKKTYDGNICSSGGRIDQGSGILGAARIVDAAASVIGTRCLIHRDASAHAILGMDPRHHRRAAQVKKNEAPTRPPDGTQSSSKLLPLQTCSRSRHRFFSLSLTTNRILLTTANAILEFHRLTSHALEARCLYFGNITNQLAHSSVVSKRLGDAQPASTDAGSKDAIAPAARGDELVRQGLGAAVMLTCESS